MYCPVCFDSGLKPASSGVIKITFNGKSKSNSQFFYDVKRDEPDDIYNKLKGVIEDYFKWYSTLQNKDNITKISITSSDFICRQGCSINVTNRLNMLEDFLNPQVVKNILNEVADKYQIKLDIKSL